MIDRTTSRLAYSAVTVVLLLLIAAGLICQIGIATRLFEVDGYFTTTPVIA